MFADSDYASYIREVESLLGQILELNTDLLNLVESKEIQSRLLVLLSEDSEAFKYFSKKRKAWEGGKA